MEIQRRTVRHLLDDCASLRPDESLFIVTDEETRAVAELFVAAASGNPGGVDLAVIAGLAMHGQEPPPKVAERMRVADVILGLTRQSLAHTDARRSACAAGARYLSLPDYSLGLLSDRSLQADFRSLGPRVRLVAGALDGAESITVTTEAGTDITMSARGRRANACPGYVDGPGQLGSPPDAEANVSPLETSANGRVVVDGSIPCPSIGLVTEPVELCVVDGSITDFSGPDAVTVELDRLFREAGSSKARILAECGVGLNDMAELTGVMLTDEGAYGTMHFGFGSNATVGGTNDIAFHLDFVFRRPTLVVDGRAVMVGGRLSP